jgi:hypothetical protein
MIRRTSAPVITPIENILIEFFHGSIDNATNVMGWDFYFKIHW